MMFENKKNEIYLKYFWLQNSSRQEVILSYLKIELIVVGNKVKNISFPTFKEEKVFSGSTESFGKQWAVGDVVGVFLDLIDKTISKYQSWCILVLVTTLAGTFLFISSIFLTLFWFYNFILYVSIFNV